MYKERISYTITVGNLQIDQVRSFTYLGTILNGNNTLEEEIREIIFKEISQNLCQSELNTHMLSCMRVHTGG